MILNNFRAITLTCSPGFLASTTAEFTEAFGKALSLANEDSLAMRHRARKSSLRFSEEVFGAGWTKQLERLVDMSVSKK